MARPLVSQASEALSRAKVRPASRSPPGTASGYADIVSRPYRVERKKSYASPPGGDEEPRLGKQWLHRGPIRVLDRGYRRGCTVSSRSSRVVHRAIMPQEAGGGIMQRAMSPGVVVHAVSGGHDDPSGRRLGSPPRVDEPKASTEARDWSPANGDRVHAGGRP